MFKTTLAALMLSSCLAVTNGSAATLFADDFNRATNDIVGNGWVEHESNKAAVRIHNNNGYGALSLTNQASSAPDASVLGGGFSTLGYNNITVSFDYKASPSGNEANDKLFFGWGLTASASTVTPAGGFFNNNTGVALSNFVTATIQLGAAAANQAAIFVSLFTNVDSNSEGYLIRNFKITGDAVAEAPAPTPLPGAALLLGSVLAGGTGFGAWRRRRKAGASQAVAG